MKKFFAILLVMAMIITLFACGNAAPAENEAAVDDAPAAEDVKADSDVTDFSLEGLTAFADAVETKGMQFYWVGKVLGGTYWTGVELGMEAAAKELGMNEIVKQGVEKETDIDVQLNNLQNAVSANPDAILAAPCDSTALDAPIKQADEQYDGPIVLIDTVIKTQGGYDVAILTNNNNAGATVARILMEGLVEKEYTEGTVVFDVVNTGSQTVIDREEGFKAYWEENAADMGLENVVCAWDDIKVDEGDQNTAMNNGQDVMTAYPDLVGMAGFNGSSVYFLSSLKDANRTDIIGVGMDFNVDSYALMQDGFEYGSVAQSTFNMGYYGVYLAVSILAGEEYDGTRIDSGLLEVRQDNLESQPVVDYINILKSAAK